MRPNHKLISLLLVLLLLAALVLPAGAAQPQDCGAKLLAITFDDGPGKYTGALLDGLAERGVHATFFVNGVNASGWPETLRRIVREGHQLANHTYNHKNLNTCSAKTVQAEIDAVQTLITAAGGDENAYIRPLRQREQDRPLRRPRPAHLLVGRPGGLEIPRQRDRPAEH